MGFNSLIYTRSFLLLFSLMSSFVYSTTQTINTVLPEKPSQTLLSSLPSFSNIQHGHTVVQLGNYWGTQGKEQNINIRTLVGNHYTITNKTSSNGLFGLGYYVDGLDTNRFHLDYGINGFYLAKTQVTGEILQEHLFTNLAYRYTTQHIPLFFGAKALVKNQQNAYNIIFDVGIGPNFMQVNHYRETPLDDFSIPDNAFSTHTQVTFAAMAGIGIRLNRVIGESPLQCGYLFFYLGEGQLHMNNSQLLNTIKTGNVFGNGLLCSITI